jgi:hypothetical protein
MSQPLRQAFADPHYAVILGSSRNVIFASGHGTPGALLPAAGFDKGALYQDVTNGHFYRNSGTTTVAVWTQLDSGTDLSTLTATATELNTLHSQTLAGGAGAGITGGTGTIYQTSVWLNGGIYTTRILIDLTGLASSTTDLDIIGTGTNPAYIGLLTAAQNGGTILTVSMQCLEAPAGGVNDIDLYSASEGTGKFDDAVTGLTETALITSGGAWTNGTTKAATVVPLSTEYLYLTGGAGGTAATYTAGKFLITLLGY